MNGGNCPQNDGSKVAKLLEEKEKDLELTAKIGQSLLDKNRELQARNDFLEESLSASDEAITQLRHELQLRISMLHVYADYEDDDLDSTSKDRRWIVESLQKRMQTLEEENKNLRLEATNLKKISAGIEEEDHFRIIECSKNLDFANEKITSLQSLLAQKSDECAVQSLEVEDLLKEIALRKNREKTLTTENDDLHEQLSEALFVHDELSKQVFDLQERYTEVVSMLRDAEEELRTFRQKHTSYRTGSVDSLYDSLASELEASDSGFYSTISSARSDIRSKCSQSSNIRLLHSKVEEKFKDKKSNNKEEVKVEVETCPLTITTEPVFSTPIKNEKSSHNPSDIFDIPSLLFTRLTRQTLKSLGRSQLGFNPEDVLKEPDVCGKIDNNNLNDDEPCKADNSDTSSDENIPRSIWPHKSKNQRFGRSPDSQSKATSSESLANYEDPKMGEPGRPGTRDLHYSMRRLNIRRQLEKDYVQFRREHGLLPLWAPFFPVMQPSANYSERFARSSLRLPSKKSTETTRRLFRKTQKCLGPASCIGLLENVEIQPTSQGILTRTSLSHFNSLTSPTTNNDGSSLERRNVFTSPLVPANGQSSCSSSSSLSSQPQANNKSCDSPSSKYSSLRKFLFNPNTSTSPDRGVLQRNDLYADSN